MEKRYIDATELLKLFTLDYSINKPIKIDLRLLKRIIIRQPVANVTEVKSGEWIISSDGYYPFCSECKYEPPFMGGKDMRTPYCPHCGAKMNGGKAE